MARRLLGWKRLQSIQVDSKEAVRSEMYGSETGWG
jgi:hypothetical protein